MKKFELSDAEFEHLKTTLEGCREEFEEMEATHDWFATSLVDRIADCLEILEPTK